VAGGEQQERPVGSCIAIKPYDRKKKERKMNDIKDLNATNKRITARLEELDAKLDLYKARAKGMKADARAEGQAVIAKLTNMRRKTAEQLDQYSKASGTALEKIGLGLEKSLNELTGAFKEAGSVMKDSAK
jgi:hypothetical protein